jgi:nucleoside-diphosphate-sugar epimerase
MTTELGVRAGSVVVVVGAGQIGRPLVARLSAAGARVRWVSRTSPSALPSGVVHHRLDACDAQALAEVARGASAMIAAVNPAVYDAAVWARTLPPLVDGLVRAAVLADVRLVLLDALYLYSLAHGPLAPTTPREPATEKGRVRLALYERVQRARASEGLRAVVLRASDFWGPGLTGALLTEAGLRDLARGKAPMLLGDPDAEHAFSYRDDVVDALVRLAYADASVEGADLHAPVIHVSPRALVAAHARALGVTASPKLAPRWLLRALGLFSPMLRGLVEMLPQWQAPYLVDDTSYTARFSVRATSLAEGVEVCAMALRGHEPARAA